jgi:hypothetical protein
MLVRAVQRWAIIARGFTEGFLFWAFGELFFPFQCSLVLLEFVCNWQMNGSNLFDQHSCFSVL